MYGCKVLGLLAQSRSNTDGMSSWRDYLGHHVLGLPGEIRKEDGLLEAAAIQRLREHRVKDPVRVLNALRWLGVLSSNPSVVMTPRNSPTVVDSFSALLEDRLRYEEGEVDMVAMRHDIIVEFPPQAGGHQEHHTSRLLVFGNAPGDSAMSVTVGKTAALATELVLERPSSHWSKKGVLRPLLPEIYNPLLDSLARESITFDNDCVQQGVEKQ